METRRGRRQLQFTGAEMALLAASFLVTSACVFFLGFYVGKRNAAAHVPRDERIARIPVDDFSRYSRPLALAGTDAAAADKDGSPPQLVAKGGEGSKADGEPASPAAQKRSDLRATSPGEADVAKTAVVAGPADDAKKAAAGDEGKTQAPLPDSAATAAEAAGRDAGDEAARKKAEAKAAAAAKAEEASRKTGAGGYTVQVLATRKQGDAEALVKKLASRGYGAYIKRVSDGQTSWYRVRVGRYGVFGEARTMADRCRRELGLEQAFVSTE